MGQSRKLPSSNPGRIAALVAAKAKYDSTPPYGTVLSGTTHTRLVNSKAAYVPSMNLISVKRAAQSGQTHTKDVSQTKAARVISHFIQAFNNGVEREVYDASERAYYGLAVDSNSVPPMPSEQSIITLGQQLIAGEANRITAGLTAVPFPTIADVHTDYDPFVAANTSQSTKKDEHTQASHAVDLLNAEADAVIKKVWDEVETFFNEEPMETRRNYLREWGVVYVSDAGGIDVTGRAKDSVSGDGIGNATASIAETGDEMLVNSDGSFTLHTNATGGVHLHLVAPGYVEKIVAITIPPTGDLAVDDVSVVHV